MRVVVIRGPEMVGPFTLSPGPNIIGRDAGCAVQLVSRRVSRKHAVAHLDGGKLKVSDMGSANGLYDEGGHRVDTVVLSHGRRVQVGDFVLRFEGEEMTESLDLDDDDPLTADDDLVLEDGEEETPARQGPVRVLRAAEPKSGRTRPLPAARVPGPPPAAPPTIPPVREKPPRPTIPDPGRLTIDPSASPIPDPPTGETSVRIARPVLPFGPPTGGFGGFMPAASAARSAEVAAPLPPTSPVPPPRAEPAGSPAPPPPFVAAAAPMSPFASPSTSTVRPVTPPPALSTALPPIPPAQAGDPATTPPILPFVPAREPLRDELTPLSNPSLPLLHLDSSRSDITPLHPTLIPREDPPTVSDAGPTAQRSRRTASGTWLVHAVGILALAGSLVLCGPFGGFAGLLYGAHTDAIALSLLRGEALAESLGNRNAVAIAEGRAISLETSFMLQSAGVRDAMVTDAGGTVLAPPERLRTTISKSATFARASAEHRVVSAESDGGTYEIIAPIRGEVATGSGARTIVGWSWVRYDPSASAGEVPSPWLRGLASLFFLGAAAGVLVAGGYWLFVRPIRSLREETELAVTNSVEKVVPIVRFGPLEELAHSINRAIERSRR